MLKCPRDKCHTERNEFMNRKTTKIVARSAIVAIVGALILIPSLKSNPLESVKASAPSETDSIATGNTHEKDAVKPSASKDNATDTDTTMTTIYKDNYKTVVLFNQAQIEALTGQSLDSAQIKDVLAELQKEATWTAQSFSASEAKLIADAAKEKSEKLPSILTKVAQNKVSDLKLIIVHNKHHSDANFGASHREQTNQNGSKDNVNKETTVEKQTTSIDNFLEFELEVEYAKGQYEVDFNSNYGKIKAEIEDERSNTSKKMQGAAALEQLEKILPKLDITNDTSKKEAISRTLEAFQLADNYKEFELEIRLPDGGQLAFKSIK